MMFDIHLAWSPIEYVMLYLVALVYVAVALKYKVWPTKSLLIGTFLFILVLGNVAAFDVGTRQNDLHRSQFNTGTIQLENVEKIQVERLTRDKVRVEFEAEIQERKEKRDE